MLVNNGPIDSFSDWFVCSLSGLYLVIYFLLLPAIALSAGILGYYTWFTASRFTRLGEQTIAENTLLLVREKVETIEQYIIDQDNAAFALVSLDAPDSLTVKWLPVAEQLTPSIHALHLFTHHRDR